MLNVDVPIGVDAWLKKDAHRRARRGSLGMVVGLAAATLSLGSCGKDVTRVRLEFRVDNDSFRPDYVNVWWQTGTAERVSRVPSEGSFPPGIGNVLGTALISLDESHPVDRRFVARGMRAGARVSGAVVTVPWSGGRESSINLTLGCYLDPAFPDQVPGCPEGSGDAGTPDAGGSNDAGADGSGDTASDRPPG
jgi:hypothetical protein